MHMIFPEGFSMSIKTYLQERQNELKNVTWPTRKQAVHSMILVLSIMLITGVLLGLFDYVLKEAVLLLINQ